jgi:CubicO group peptidase (beta-lactamase class C family)
MMNSIAWRPAAALLCLIALTVPAGRAAELTPEKVTAALPELEKIAQQALEKTGVPGMAIGVVYQDQVVYLKGFGVRQVGTAAAVDPDTVFQLASVSKPMASTVLARLVGEGVIGWDDRAIDHDPEFRLYDPWVTREVTLRDLLCHRTGLPGQEGDLLEDLGYSGPEILRRLRYVKPDSSFRSHYAYDNFTYTEAGVAGARAAGKSWQDLCVEKLYRPLGMSSTSSRVADYRAAPNRAVLHVNIDGKWVAKYERDPDPEAPAGGASSTVRDMAQWLRLQLGGGKFNGQQLIAAEALAETHRPQIVNTVPQNPATDRAGFYGLGWGVAYDDHGRVRVSHSGAFSVGAATQVALLPAEGLGIVVLTNAAPIGVPESVSASFFDLVLTGNVQRDWLEFYRQAFDAYLGGLFGGGTDYSRPPAQTSPPLSAAAYVGTYHNDFFGDIEVSAAGTDGGLVLQLGPKKISYPLQHFDRDLFVYQPAGEAAGGASGVAFRVGPDQKATSVLIEELDIPSNGQGTFTRVPAGN